MTTSVDLDDLNAIQQLDSEDVLGAVERFADQCSRGLGDRARCPGPPRCLGRRIGGGARHGGIWSFGRCSPGRSRAPPGGAATNNQELRPTAGMGGAQLPRVRRVLLGKHRGNRCRPRQGARSRGCRIVAVSSGGPLADRAVPEEFAHVRIPQGHQPRASLGYLTMPLLAVLVKVGLVPDMQDEVDEAVAVLSDIASRCHRKHGPDNPAKALAGKLKGRVPIVYGGHGLGSVAAYPFKCDLNEYAKSPAFAGTPARARPQRDRRLEGP